ncbi:MAG: aldo/keto reductase [Spirochaetales bacterium]|nr:aldo/keto reductase [Spirochaetales bacterium]
MSDIATRTLGRTGEKVSMIGLGGANIGRQDSEQESISIIRTAIDGGITFMDNSWDYNEGQSEIRMGKALRDGYRDKVFLMTKIDGQSWKAATEQLEESLRRLQTDTIDLLQFHEIIRMSDPDHILAPGAGLDAVLAAQKAGKVRYIGFTGHKSPEIHLNMFTKAHERGFIFDTVQMPLGVLDHHYKSFEKQVLPVLVENNVGVLAMKTLAAGYLPTSGIATKEECLHYALSLPVSVVITGFSSLAELGETLRAARNFTPMTGELRAALLARTAAAAGGDQNQLWKSTSDMKFDATLKNPGLLGRDA